MADENENSSRAPLEVFTIRELEGAKDFWVRIGVAFVNQDRSVNVLLDALPVNGKLQIRKPRPRDGHTG